MTKFVFNAKVNINETVLRGKAIKALDEYAAKIGDEFQDQIESEKWAWTNTATKRSNGRTAGNPRDIVDTGELRDSQQGPAVADGGLAQGFKWSAPYASLVQQGYIGRGGIPIPKRDWVAGALKALPFAQFIARRMRS
jgi:hypothetical protein